MFQGSGFFYFPGEDIQIGRFFNDILGAELDGLDAFSSVTLAVNRMTDRSGCDSLTIFNALKPSISGIKKSIMTAS